MTTTCEQCGKIIAEGEPSTFVEGHIEGEDFRYEIHSDCYEAAETVSREAGLTGEEYPWFQYQDDEPADWKWMVERYPEVAKRLGWDERLKEVHS